MQRWMRGLMHLLIPQGQEQVQGQKQLQEQGSMRGSFAALRMTAKNLQRQRQGDSAHAKEKEEADSQRE